MDYEQSLSTTVFMNEVLQTFTCLVYTSTSFSSLEIITILNFGFIILTDVLYFYMPMNNIFLHVKLYNK